MPRNLRNYRLISRMLTPETHVEFDFSKGVISDADSGALAPGQVLYCNNFMLDKPGVAYKRGGFSHVGGTCGTSCYRVELAEFPTLGTPEVLAWNSDLKLYRLVAGVWTATGAPTTFGADSGYYPAMHPVIVPDATNTVTRGNMIWAVAAGNDVPRVYPGNGGAVRVINVATGLAGAQGGRYLAVYKSRLALASSTVNEQRIWFSPDFATGVETAWDITTSYVDADYKITGLAALSNVLLIFSRSHLERLTGSSPPPGGDMSHGTIAEVGCTDSRSIAIWQDNAIWANPSGVYMSNGGAPIDLTREGGIKRAWRGMFGSYVETSDVLAGAVYKNFYIVSMNGAGGLMWVLDIPRRAWWQLNVTNFPVWYARNPMLGETFYAVSATNRVRNLAPFFAPTTGTRADADGNSISASIQGRYVNGGAVGLKAWRDARINYALQDSAASATLSANWEGQVVTNGVAATSLAATSTLKRARAWLPLSVVDEAVQLRFSQTTACDLCEIYGGEVDFRPLSLDRGGAS